MNRGFRIGRLFGIEINADWSWLIIFALITWSLGSGLTQLHSNWSGGTVWIVSIVASLLFFGSVLAHEMAHSLFARSRGIPVKSITLFLFGGVSSIQKEPDSPGSEFVMAILGPVTSLVIGGVLLLITRSMTGPISGVMIDPYTMARSMGPVTTVLGWLGSINVILGIFNLVPGFPLDGGRVLRSIIWAIVGDVRKATHAASLAGRGIGVLMIMSGIAMVFGLRLPFFGTGFGGLWLALIGWFLYSAASRSYTQVVVQDILRGVPVTAIAIAEPPPPAPDSSVSALVHDHIMQSDDHAFPVVRGESLLGLVTLGDVRSVPRDRWDSTKVEQIMTPLDKLAVLSPEDDAAAALSAIAQRDIRQLPIVRDGRLLGMVRRRDLVRWLQVHSELGGGGQ